MRLFLGTYLNAECRERLRIFQTNNTTSASSSKTLEPVKVRWVPEDKLHMTWNFLGHVNEGMLPHLLESVELALDAFRLQPGAGTPLPLVSFEQPTIWPRPGSPRLIVVQPRHTNDAFDRLGQLLRAHMDKFVEKDRGEHYETFKPHVTLARLGGWREDARQLKFALSDFTGWDQLLPMLLNIESVDLISSETARGINAYKTVQRFSVNKFHKP
jgi:2'-5' RNA ligase